ncbi:hypothetical protein [Nocardia sp. CNY236]|uniref:rhodanese-like domain-containing protein n=1 Tax=Nocardia sp. CNY236 TaxID=1169152 RepID=UPI00042278C0|nr:hypothetical protein [Nocardia sp. CNY236]
MLDHQLLDECVSVDELPRAIALGGVVVDIRAQWQRTADGPLLGALAIDSEIVGRRLDPAGATCISWARLHTGAWILVSSSGRRAAAVAATLRGTGVGLVTSLAGGYRALCAANRLTVALRTPHFERSVDMVLATHAKGRSPQ